VIATLGWILLVFIAGYYVPGRLATLLLLRDEVPEERLVTSLGVGILLVHVAALLITGVRGIFGPVHMTRSLVLMTSGGCSLILAGLVLWRRRDRLSALRDRPTRRQAILWGLTAVMTLVFAVNYDVDIMDEDSCILRAATAVVHPYLQAELVQVPGEDGLSIYHDSVLGSLSSERNDFIAHNQFQRLGPTVLVAPSMALFGIPGLRIIYALQGLLLPGLGLVLGLRLLRSRWGPWAVAVLLPLSPYAMQVHLLDENFMSSIFGTLMLVFLVRPRPAWALAGGALSLFLGIRHVGVVMVPFVAAYVLMIAPRRARAMASLFGTLALLGLPYIILHGFLYSFSGQVFEGGASRPPAAHTFFGLQFELSVLLNFPFVEAPVRSPYNAYPPALAYPLEFILRYGVLTSALVVPGIAWLRTVPGERRLLLLGWVLPLWAILAVQSNWVEPNKMGIPASALAPVVLLLVGGAERLANRSAPLRGRLILGAVGLATVLVLFLALRTIQTSPDHRVYETLPTYLTEFFGEETILHLEETPDFIEFERARFRVRLLPDVIPQPLLHGHAGRLFRALGRELTAPSVSDWAAPNGAIAHLVGLGRSFYMGPLSLSRQAASGRISSDWEAFQACEADAPSGDGVPGVLDLTRSPSVAPEPLRVVDREGAGPVVDLAAPGWTAIRDVSVPFALEPVTILLGHDCNGLLVVLVGPRGKPDARYDLTGIRLETMGEEALEDTSVRLLLPRDAVILVRDIRSLRPTRSYVRHGSISDGGIHLGSAHPQSF